MNDDPMDLGFPLPNVPPPVPQAPGIESFLPKPNLAQKLGPLAAAIAAVALGPKRGGGGVAAGYTLGQNRVDQNNLHLAELQQQDAIRQQAFAQRAADVAAQQEQQRMIARANAVNTVRQQMKGVTDKAQYDQMIDGYATTFQQAGVRMTPNQLRLEVPFVAKDAKQIAGDAVNAWLRNPANTDALKKDPTIIGRSMLRIDTNGDGIPENVPLLRAGELGGIQFAQDEQGNALAVEGEDKIGDKFKELYGAKRARFLADNRREPDPKEKEDLIKSAIRESSEEARKPETTEDAIDPSSVETAAAAILSGRMAPSQLSLSGGMGKAGVKFKQAVMASVNRQNPQFNWAASESNYQFGKSPATQNTVRFLDNIEKTLPVLEQASDDFQRSGVRVINKAILTAKSQFGATDVVKFDLARTILADEIAKVLQGGGTGAGTSDAKLKQAQDLLSGDLTPQQLKAVTASVRELLQTRRQSLTQGTYMERPASPLAVNPASVSPDAAILAARKRQKP